MARGVTPACSLIARTSGGPLGAWPRVSDHRLGWCRAGHADRGPRAGLASAHAIAAADGAPYVRRGSQTIAVFPLTGNGNIPATRRLSIADWISPTHMAVHRGELYVAGAYDGESRAVFSATPLEMRSRAGCCAGRPHEDPHAGGLTLRGDELFVSTHTSIDVLSINGDGPVAALELAGRRCAPERDGCGELYAPRSTTDRVHGSMRS
jgi:hypothetical protein